MWLGRLFAEIRGEEIDLVTLKIDNLSAIQLSKNPVLHDRSKHIDTRYHYIQHCVDEGRVQVEFIGTADELADILTVCRSTSVRGAEDQSASSINR
jgi:hypothetical protein